MVVMLVSGSSRLIKSYQQFTGFTITPLIIFTSDYTIESSAIGSHSSLKSLTEPRYIFRFWFLSLVFASAWIRHRSYQHSWKYAHLANSVCGCSSSPFGGRGQTSEPLAIVGSRPYRVWLVGSTSVRVRMHTLYAHSVISVMRVAAGTICIGGLIILWIGWGF